MYAVVDYKGSHIYIKKGEKFKVPYQKDAKVGGAIIFDQVLFYDDGKKKQVGSPYLKTVSLKGKIISHEKENKVIVFKKKRRKGYHKKNGHKQNVTVVEVSSFEKTKSSTSKKAVKASTTKTNSKKNTSTKKISSKKTTKKKD